jgi:hypothetical protein
MARGVKRSLTHKLHICMTKYIYQLICLLSCKSVLVIVPEHRRILCILS